MKYNLRFRGWYGYVIEQLQEREIFSTSRTGVIRGIMSAQILERSPENSAMKPDFTKSSLDEIIDYTNRWYQIGTRDVAKRLVTDWIDAHMGELKKIGISVNNPDYRNYIRKQPLKAVEE